MWQGPEDGHGDCGPGSQEPAEVLQNAMSLNEAIQEDRNVVNLARNVTGGTMQAIKAYVDFRMGILKQNVGDLPDWQILERKKSAVALKRLLSELEIPKDLVTETVAPRPQGEQTTDDHLCHLHDVLTPPGWKDDLLPTLLELVDTVGIDLLDENQDVADEKAYEQELRILMAMLHNIDRQGSGAKAEQADRARKTNGN